jgi:uncharacterized protein YjiS (DUF1127 family)
MLAQTGSRIHAQHIRPRFGFRAALDWLAAHDARHRARLDLGRLDPHLLRDIGLTEGDVALELRRTGGL